MGKATKMSKMASREAKKAAKVVKAAEKAKAKSKIRAQAKVKLASLKNNQQKSDVPMDDVTSSYCVHRCRFVEVEPSAITALAFDASSTRLAVARKNGDIEVWSVAPVKTCILRFPGTGEDTVRSLAWVPSLGGQSERLLSSGLNARLIEWDFATLNPKTSSDSYGGAVWSMSLSHDKKRIALGCEDGTIRLFDVADDALSYQKCLPSHGPRTLSVAWSHDDSLLFAGSSNGLIRVWSDSQALLRITLDKVGHRKKPAVWALLALPNGSLVSGDSYGRVQYWDSQHGTLLQSFAEHTSDVLCLAASVSGTAVYSSGVDAKIVLMTAVSESEFKVSGFARRHTHDVLALAASNDFAATKIAAVSGGIDSQMCVYDAVDSLKSVTKVAPFLHESVVSVCRARSVFVVRQPRSMHVWKIGAEPQHLLEISLANGLNLLCASISPDGNYITCSDSLKTKLFRVSYSDEQVSVERISISSVISASSALTFSPDSSAMISGGVDGVVRVMDVAQLKLKAEFSQHVPAIDASDDELAQPLCIRHLNCSDDGTFVASADSRKVVNVFRLDQLEHHCTLPTLELPQTCMKWQPGTSNLVVVLVSNKFYIYDVPAKRLGEWSSRNSHHFPALLTRQPHKVFNVMFDEVKPTKMFLQSHSFLCRVDLKQNLMVKGEPSWSKSKKRGGSLTQHRGNSKRSTLSDEAKASPFGEAGAVLIGGGDKQDPNAPMRFLQRFRPMLFADFIGDAAMLVIETPWIQIMKNFPAVLHRKRYGL